MVNDEDDAEPTRDPQVPPHRDRHRPRRGSPRCRGRARRPARRRGRDRDGVLRRAAVLRSDRPAARSRRARGLDRARPAPARIELGPGAQRLAPRPPQRAITSLRTDTPMPGPVGTGSCPSVRTQGSVTSSAKYRFDALRSPASVNPGSAASATFTARPMPVSSIPPISAAVAPSTHASCTRFASRTPPTRPGLMLTTRQAPNAIASRAIVALVTDSSSAIGVVSRFASSLSRGSRPVRVAARGTATRIDRVRRVLSRPRVRTTRWHRPRA